MSLFNKTSLKFPLAIYLVIFEYIYFSNPVPVNRVKNSNNISKVSVSIKNSKSILPYISLLFCNSGIVLVTKNRIKYKSHNFFLFF